MNIFDDFEYKGMWLLPSNPEKIAAGVLTKRDDEVVLELIGAFDDEESPFEFFMDKEREPVVHGLTSDAKEISLLNCHVSGSYNLSCPFALVRYKCQAIVIGKHVNSVDDSVAISARFRYPILNYWCRPTNIKQLFLNGDDEHPGCYSVSFDLELKEIAKTEIGNGMVLTLASSASYSSGDMAPVLNQSTYLDISVNNGTAKISDFLNIGFQYKQFLSLASLEDATFDSVVLHDEGHKSFDVIYTWWCRDFTSELPKKDFLFDYTKIAESYPDIIKKWYEDYETVAPIRGHLIDSIKSPRVFNSVEFLTVIQAVEGFYYRYRDKKKGKANKTEILNNLKDEFKDIAIIANDDINIDQVKDSRDYYSHLLPKGKKKKVLYAFDLYDLTCQLRRLLLCCVLTLIGFEHDQINEVFKTTNNRYIKE